LPHVGLTGECNCPVNSEKPTLWTTAPTFTQTPSSVHPVYRPCLSFWVHCTNIFNFPNVGSTGDTKIPDVLQVNAPTYVIFLASVLPVILKCLCLDFFDLVSLRVFSLFIPWTYKPDNNHLNTYISPSVVCVINRQNIILKYGMRGHFRYNLPLFCD